MANGKQLLRMTVIVLAIAGVLGFRMEALGMLEKAADTNGRPDAIMIDTIAGIEELEQSAAVFKHDAHTKALKDQGMSCESCHEKNAESELVLSFKRQEDGMTAGELKDLYHDGCISCHVESGEKGFKTGPMAGECRGCHQAVPEVVADRVDPGMDNMLHFIHWDSKVIPADSGKDTNCGACHAKPGEEDAWRFDPEFAARPVNEAYHAECVTCHQSLIEKKAERSGPVQCAGCHGKETVAARKAEEAKTLEAMGELPRLPRNQPDAALLFHGEPGEVHQVVAFDHKGHEAAVDNCVSCHVDGVNAPLEKNYKAMHDPASDTSCVGCHVKEQEKPECAGCHAPRSSLEQPADATCAVCHTRTPENAAAATMPGASDEMKRDVAEDILLARSGSREAVAVKDIPDVVTIGTLADEYRPSKMPHRKIVLALADGMKDSPLAAAFHTVPKAMCSGCHHNSPAQATPKCSSCHADTDGNRPGLKAAYHGQCMTCHTEMKLEKPAATDCTACHEKKAN